MEPGRTQYARSGDVHIAYQVFGEGAVDLVFVPGFISHIENYWEEPGFARWLQRLGSFARVVMFDKRGTGLSDRVSELPGMEERLDDVRSLMDAVGIELRAGLHTGEIELMNDDVGGMAVHIAARVMARAGVGEVWVSRTLKDLVVGSGFAFRDQGVFTLKGIPDDWRLFAVEQ